MRGLHGSGESHLDGGHTLFGSVNLLFWVARAGHSRAGLTTAGGHRCAVCARWAPPQRKPSGRLLGCAVCARCASSRRESSGRLLVCRVLAGRQVAVWSSASLDTTARHMTCAWNLAP